MSVISYPGDRRKYLKYKKKDRYYVKCTATQEDDKGNILECDYKDIREDKHKKRSTPHVCNFVRCTHTNTISWYFNAQNMTQTETSKEALYSKIAVLGGQKNLSLTFLESKEFYDLLISCIITGANMIDKNQGILGN